MYHPPLADFHLSWIYERLPLFGSYFPLYLLSNCEEVYVQN